MEHVSLTGWRSAEVVKAYLIRADVWQIRSGVTIPNLESIGGVIDPNWRSLFGCEKFLKTNSPSSQIISLIRKNWSSVLGRTCGITYWIFRDFLGSKSCEGSLVVLRCWPAILLHTSSIIRYHYWPDWHERTICGPPVLTLARESR